MSRNAAGMLACCLRSRIVQAIEYNSPRVLITKEAHMADALKRLMPATADGIVARVFKRISP